MNVTTPSWRLPLGIILYCSVLSGASAQIFDMPDIATNSRWSSLGLALENDSFDSRPTDYDYTNGLRIYLQGSLSNQLFNSFLDRSLSGFIRDHYTPDSLTHFLEIGQNMYTPSNLTDDKPILNDRPYAAWTRIGYYLGATRHFAQPFGWNSDDSSDNTTDYFGISIGSLGDAGGGFTQTAIHQMFQTWNRRQDPPIPQGWANHIENRLAYYLVYDSSSNILSGYGTGDKYGALFELLAHSTTELGNVFDRQTLGFQVRGTLAVLKKPEHITKRKDFKDEECVGISPFIKTNMILSAYNGTLDARNGNDYSIYMVPVVFNWQAGLNVTATFGDNAMVYLRWLFLNAETAEFATKSEPFSMTPPNGWVHTVGGLSLQYYYKL